MSRRFLDLRSHVSCILIFDVLVVFQQVCWKPAWTKSNWHGSTHLYKGVLDPRNHVFGIQRFQQLSSMLARKLLETKNNQYQWKQIQKGVLDSRNHVFLHPEVPAATWQAYWIWKPTRTENDWHWLTQVQKRVLYPKSRVSYILRIWKPIWTRGDWNWLT